jgi:hypothetical protein
MVNLPKVIPFQTLPDGRLLTPWETVLISVEESKSLYEQWLEEYLRSSTLPLEPFMAMAKILANSKFDPICGHWIATKREKKGYFYVSMTIDGKKQDVGAHAVAQMVMGSEFPPETRHDGSQARPPVDHRCFYEACFCPWHTEVTSTGENTRRGRQDRKALSLHIAGHRPFWNRHELAP